MLKSPTPEQRIACTRLPTDRQPALFQKWRDLLFLHWSVDPALIQQTLPPGLQVDTCEGRAYLGVVPFAMKGVRPRFCPPVPGLSTFPELNLRTYVHDEAGWPGVWFYSLDAHQRLAVAVAKRFFHLPYHYATMRAGHLPPKQASPKQGSGQSRAFTSQRPHGRKQEFTYTPGRPLPPTRPGSLEFFLVERYLLYSWNPRNRRLYRGQVHHRPYPLREASVERYSAELFSVNGFDQPQNAPESVMASDGVDVTIYPLQNLA